MRNTNIFILLLLSQIISAFSQEITGNLLYIDNEKPATGNIYLDDIPDLLATKNIQKDGTFTISNFKNISSIKIENIWGSIILTGFDYSSEINYELGNIYFIDNPNNELHHFIYKTKIGYYLSWLTEGPKSRRLTRKAIKRNRKILEEKYIQEGKKVKFLKKYTGNEQILDLNYLK